MRSTPHTRPTGPWRLRAQTPLGVFLPTFTVEGLSRLDFPSSSWRKGGALVKAVPQEVRQWRRVTERALRASLKGEAPGQFPPLDWSGSTAFQCKVWQALLAIPAGGTVSYGELARSIGSPRAFRAVGGACGANPIPVLVPCHRVVASDGGLGGFSGGLSMKRQLLQIEGVAV